MGKAAAGQDHGACLDAQESLGALDQRADHLAVTQQQFAGWRRFDQAHTQGFGGLGQARYQGHAIDQVHGATVAQQVPEVAGKAPGDMQEGRQRAGQVEEGGEVGTGHDRHAHERGLPQGLAQARQQRAQLPCVIGRGDQLVAALGGARRVAMHVRDAVAVDEPQVGVALEEGHHVRAGFEEGVDPRGVVTLAQFVAQVGTRLLDVLLDTGATRQRVARQPGPAAGPGAGAAEHRVLLHQDYPAPVPGRGHRRRQPGGAGADDQHVTG